MVICKVKKGASVREKSVGIGRVSSPDDGWNKSQSQSKLSQSPSPGEIDGSSSQSCRSLSSKVGSGRGGGDWPRWSENQFSPWGTISIYSDWGSDMVVILALDFRLGTSWTITFSQKLLLWMMTPYMVGMWLCHILTHMELEGWKVGRFSLWAKRCRREARREKFIIPTIHLGQGQVMMMMILTCSWSFLQACPTRRGQPPRPRSAPPALHLHFSFYFSFFFVFDGKTCIVSNPEALYLWS